MDQSMYYKTSPETLVLMIENGEVSLKKNFAYKGLLTVATPIMGMITFPYISRVLGVENVGLVNFVDNTISYFLLFATMGIGTLGVRAIAQDKRNALELNRTFSNILGLNLIFTIGVLIIFNLSILLTPGFREYSELLYIGNAKILFSSLLIEWFYNGIENFKYITLRSLIIRLIYVISIFLFIKQEEDFKIYFLLTIGITVINATINILYSRKFVQIVPKYLVSSRFLKENINLGIYAIMTSMYLTFNVMFLGLRTDNIEVGYYTSAYKIYHLILSIYSAFSSVMMPRMSAIAKEENTYQFYNLIDKSINFIAIFSMPIIPCCCIMAPEIIYLLCGEGYEGAVLPMRIILLALLPVGLAHVIAMQVLIPQQQDKVLLKASILGATVSIVMNILLIDKFQSIGSAVVLLISESILTVTYLLYIRKHKIIKINTIPFVKYFATAIPSIVICIISKECIVNPFLSLITAIISGGTLYIALNHQQICQIINKH